MKTWLINTLTLCFTILFIMTGITHNAYAAGSQAAKSPWGTDDEIGALNMMTEQSRLAVLGQISSGKVYDLAVELFVGMPGCCKVFGDQDYQIWMTHTPARGKTKSHISHSGDAISMYTHTGTHIDTLNHFGLNGEIWNQVSADDALSTRGWEKSGAENYPPVIARGVLIDVATAKDITPLPSSYAISRADLQTALKKQGTTLQAGDVVLVRTGLMSLWPDKAKYRFGDQAGLGLDAAQWLAEDQKVMLIGSDNFGVESFPSTDKNNFAPVHTYLLAERGVSIMEVMWLEELAKDKVYEFLFMASPLKLRGATGSPMRPIAIPIQ